MTDFIEISDDGETWERVDAVPEPRPNFIRSGTTSQPEPEPEPTPPPVNPEPTPEAPVVGTCAVCNAPLTEADARIETANGALAHPEHDLTPKQQDKLPAPEADAGKA